jgi:hypothetical protein
MSRGRFYHVVTVGQSELSTDNANAHQPSRALARQYAAEQIIKILDQADEDAGTLEVIAAPASCIICGGHDARTMLQ